jgi:hypothetical protein
MAVFAHEIEHGAFSERRCATKSLSVGASFMLAVGVSLAIWAVIIASTSYLI